MPSDKETAASLGLLFLHLWSDKLERDDGGPSQLSILSLHLNTAFLIPNKCIFHYARLFLCLNKGDLIPQVHKQIRETVEREPGKQGTADERRGLRGGKGEEGGSQGAFYKSQSRAGRASSQGNCSLHWPFSFCGVIFILWRHLPGNLLMGGRGLRADAFAGRERQGLWSRCKQSYNANTQEGFRDWLEGQWWSLSRENTGTSQQLAEGRRWLRGEGGNPQGGVWWVAGDDQTLDTGTGKFCILEVPLCLPLLEGTFPIDIPISRPSLNIWKKKRFRFTTNESLASCFYNLPQSVFSGIEQLSASSQSVLVLTKKHILKFFKNAFQICHFPHLRSSSMGLFASFWSRMSKTVCLALGWQECIKHGSSQWFKKMDDLLGLVLFGVRW